MITEDKLLEAIAECWGEREPNANTCYKLAAYYTILNEIRRKQGAQEEVSYSYDSKPNDTGRVVSIQSESDFANAINGMSEDKAWLLMDELMGTLYVINQPFYNKVLRRISESM